MDIEKQDSQVAVDLLKIALTEAQHSVRSYDSKAQICAIGYVFSLNIILGINQALWPETAANIWTVVVGWGVLLLPMVFFAYVLYPSRRSVRSDDNEDSNNARKVLYIRHERYFSVNQIKAAALESDLLDELAFELLKSSTLRDRKRIRFLRALLLALIAFVLMSLFHFGEVISR